MKTFSERIQEVGRESIDFIYEHAGKKGVAIKEEDFIVTAFDDNGEAYSTYAVKLFPTSIITDEEYEIDLSDLSNHSNARLADYLAEAKNISSGK